MDTFVSTTGSVGTLPRVAPYSCKAALTMAARASFESPRWPFGMSRAVAAEYVGFSTGHFDKMVDAGKMPAARKEGSRLVWLRDELEAALRALPAESEDGPNEWDTAA